MSCATAASRRSGHGSSEPGPAAPAPDPVTSGARSPFAGQPAPPPARETSAEGDPDRVPPAGARERPAPDERSADVRAPRRRAETADSVRAAVSGAASTRGSLAEGAARALLAIAGLLERVSEDEPGVVAPIERMRDEIARLEQLSRVDLDRADRVKAALERGVDAMREVARGREKGSLNAWVEAAARATSAIDPATPLRLAHARVQDALRALADAVIAAEQ